MMNFSKNRLDENENIFILFLNSQGFKNFYLNYLFLKIELLDISLHIIRVIAD
jgi:hypothetical protein